MHLRRDAALALAAGLGLWALTRSNNRETRSLSQREREQDAPPRVVILGAGFAGMTAARRLARRLPHRAEITLIDRHNYHLFTPILYQVAACGVDPYDAAYPVRQYAGRHGVSFRQGTVAGVDLDRAEVCLEGGATVPYDYLIVALGTTTNFFGNDSARQHALPLKRLEDGLAIRNAVLDRLERAAVTRDEAERRALLTFVVVGGGATGVEAAGALADLLRRTLPAEYPALDPSEARAVLIQSEGKLLGHMADPMARHALEALRGMGVEVWLNARAKEVAPDRVTTEDGRAVRSRTALWTTGVRVPEVVSHIDAPHGKGGSLKVDAYLAVEGQPGVWAAGDCAHVEQPGGGSVPLLAASAVQAGEAVAENVARAIEGRPQRPFRYRDYGNVVSLGRRAGTAEMGPFVIDGFPAWLAWRLIHLVRITGFRDRLATLLDWSVGYVYDRDTARLDVQPTGGAHGA